MPDDTSAAASGDRMAIVHGAGGTGPTAPQGDQSFRRLQVGDDLIIQFMPEALRYERSLDIRRGRTVLLHLVVRPAQKSIIVNNHDGTEWGSEHSLPLADHEFESTIPLRVTFREDGAQVRLSDGRTMLFDRFIPDGTQCEFVAPPGVTVSSAIPAVSSSIFDLPGWLERAAKDASVAELGSLAAEQPGLLPTLALREGAVAVTLVDVAPLFSPTWLPLQEVPRYASARERRAYLLQTSWADPDLSEQVGPHDIILCHDILPHTTDPLRLLLELRAMTKRNCFVSVPILPDLIEDEYGVLDVAAIGGVFLPAAAPSLLARLQAAAPKVTALVPPWIDRGECNPHALWWAMTRRYVETLIELAGFRVSMSVLTDGPPQRLEVLLDVA